MDVGVEVVEAGEDNLEDLVSCAMRGFGGISEKDLSFLKTEDEKSGKDVEVPVCCERFSDLVCFFGVTAATSPFLSLRESYQSRVHCV